MNFISYFLAGVIVLILVVDVFTCLNILQFLKALITFNFPVAGEVMQTITLPKVVLLILTPKVVKIFYDAIRFESV